MAGIIHINLKIFAVNHGTDVPPSPPWKHIDGKRYSAQVSVPVYVTDRGVRVSDAVDKFLQEFNMAALRHGVNVELHRDKSHSGGGIYIPDAEKKRARAEGTAFIDALVEEMAHKMEEAAEGAAAAAGGGGGWLPRTQAKFPPVDPEVAAVAAEQMPGTPFAKGVIHATHEVAARRQQAATEAALAAALGGMKMGGGARRRSCGSR